MNRILFFILFLFFFTASLFAQTPAVTISTAQSCAGQEVLLSVTASDLMNIESIGLYVDVDPARLTFLSLENINPQIINLYYNFIKNPPKVAVAWNNIVPVSFKDARLFDMKFYVNAAGTPVAFASGCEIADITLQPLTINWSNGAVDPANPVIFIQPGDANVSVTKNASFLVSSLNATDYQWEGSQDGISWQNLQDGDYYKGTTTNRLSIVNVPLTLNKFKFRCFTSNGKCNTISDAATLSVNSSSSINEGMNTDFNLMIQPNPFTESAQIDFTIPEEGNVHIRIYSVLGNQVADLINAFHSKGQYKIPFSPAHLQKGVYACQLEYLNGNTNLYACQTMIKN